MKPSAACAALIAALVAASSANAQLSITDPGQGVFSFTAPTGELSGITWLADSSWLAISDAAGERRTAELDSNRLSSPCRCRRRRSVKLSVD